MSQEIEFLHDWFAEVETIPGRMRQVAFHRGSRLHVEVCRIACRTGDDEFADLRLTDGTVARRIPLERFAVVASQARAAA